MNSRSGIAAGIRLQHCPIAGETEPFAVVNDLNRDEIVQVRPIAVRSSRPSSRDRPQADRDFSSVLRFHHFFFAAWTLKRKLHHVS